MPCFRTAASCAGLPRRKSKPPCTFGCNVFRREPRLARFEPRGGNLPSAGAWTGEQRRSIGQNSGFPFTNSVKANVECEDLTPIPAIRAAIQQDRAVPEVKDISVLNAYGRL